ncbi:IgGFc-binding protein-like [Hyperolius riggenbachi]|uniref:IgGFc-binding protein-like n=1 Tax=Hyperolius riggenbachi TaxID=752182 RepID=UPI0035A3CF87
MWESLRMPNILQFWVLVAVFSGCCRAGSLGRDFIAVFLQNDKTTENSLSKTIFMHAYNSTNVNITINNEKLPGFSTNGPSTQQTILWGRREFSGIIKSNNVTLIKSDKDIFVITQNYESGSCDATVVSPISDLGTEYYIVTPNISTSPGLHEFAVISASESTDVDIILKGTVTYERITYKSGDRLKVNLPPYTAVQLQSRDVLSGTRVMSQKPVAVLSGHTCLGSTSKCNHVYKQLKPVSSWGTEFYVPPVSSTSSNTVYVVASQTTTIKVVTDQSPNGISKTLAASESFDNKYYDFQGTCTYTLVSVCGNDTGLTPFSIQAKNENRGSTRVSYVSYVTIRFYDIVIYVVRSEVGYVRVNNQRQRLPFTLANGQVMLYQSGNSLIVTTNFTLKVIYDWNFVLQIYISSSYFQNLCGMCGYYNENPNDDFATPSGVQAGGPVDFGKSWKVNDGNKLCWDDCNGVCLTCSLEQQKIYYDETKCGLITKPDGPFSQCLESIDSKIFADNCVYDACLNGGSKQILCNSLATYADICQKRNITIREWRDRAGCVLPCPANSQYKLCGKTCPPTCNDAAINATGLCPDGCVESCQCNDGFVLDGGKCIPKANCGCVFQGKVYAPNETFWADTKCLKQCTCNPATNNVDCKDTRCKPTETCSVSKGIQGCYPNSYATCTAAGDPHYNTFDGVPYDFQGTCVYLFTGLCNKTADLVDFQVYVQNENRIRKTVSFTAEVRVFIYNIIVVISRIKPGKIQVNGILTNLPVTYNQGTDIVSMYRSGNSAVLQTNFGFKVSYNWDSRIVVTVPSTYAGQLCGLCGKYDGNKINEFITKDNKVAANPTIFGKSWNVQIIPGCSEDDKANCSKTTDLEQNYRNSKTGCGIIVDKTGPFRECQTVVDPESRFKDCVFDVCIFGEKDDILCKAISSYALSCQAAGAGIYPWRTDTFCEKFVFNISPAPDDITLPPPLCCHHHGSAAPTGCRDSTTTTAKCGINAHYEICGASCPATCLTISSPSFCEDICIESCVCDDGFILSGDTCVPIANCGCSYQGLYYKTGETFFLDDSCSQLCECTNTTLVVCKAFSCGPNEECKVVAGVRACQPKGSSQCSILGGSHYTSFDGQAFDLQGTCTYTLVKTVTSNANLIPFTINVKNEKLPGGLVATTKMVSVEVYVYILILQYDLTNQLKVNGVLYNLPLNLDNGKVIASQHGNKIILDIDFGLRVSFDLVYGLGVTVPGNYKSQLAGLCGSYNGIKGNDFLLPNNTTASNVVTFASGWRVQVPGEDCDNGCGSPDKQCSPCNPKRIEFFKSNMYCGFLKKSEALSPCFAVISPDNYFNSCLLDMCYSSGDKNVLCQR